jgi:hypothetical protein
MAFGNWGPKKAFESVAWCYASCFEGHFQEGGSRKRLVKRFVDDIQAVLSGRL